MISPCRSWTSIWRLKALFLLILLLSIPASAQEALSFRAPGHGYKDKAALEFLTQGGFGKDVLLAETDLNGDGVSEYVARIDEPGCREAAACPFSVVAFRDRAPLLIGEFRAGNTRISGKKAYGVRDILVYNQPRNDFTFRTYAWDPFSFRYRPQEPAE